MELKTCLGCGEQLRANGLDICCEVDVYRNMDDYDPMHDAALESDLDYKVCPMCKSECMAEDEECWNCGESFNDD